MKIAERINAAKRLMQTAVKQKSIKVFRDGTVTAILRYKPNEMPVQDALKRDNAIKDFVNKVEAITGVRYKIKKVQFEPAFCYNTYARLLSKSSAASGDKMKIFFKYFEKDGSGKFVKSSYCQIICTAIPEHRDGFDLFLNQKEGD